MLLDVFPVLQRMRHTHSTQSLFRGNMKHRFLQPNTVFNNRVACLFRPGLHKVITDPTL